MGALKKVQTWVVSHRVLILQNSVCPAWSQPPTWLACRQQCRPCIRTGPCRSECAVTIQECQKRSGQVSPSLHRPGCLRHSLTTASDREANGGIMLCASCCPSGKRYPEPRERNYLISHNPSLAHVEAADCSSVAIVPGIVLDVIYLQQHIGKLGSRLLVSGVRQSQQNCSQLCTLSVSAHGTCADCSCPCFIGDLLRYSDAIES